MPNLRRAEATDITPPDLAPVDDWVHELIAMTRPGIEIDFPSRTLRGRAMPFEYDDFS